jgi:ribosomal protein S18 acetylase RimI-like enzyme
MHAGSAGAAGPPPGPATLFPLLEGYYDAVPRTAARVETLGPFSLFVQRESGWPYYARPALGATAFTVADVERVRARQRALGVPEAFEWVAETSPGLRPVATGAGLAVTSYPLLVLPPGGLLPAPPPEGIVLRLATADDDVAMIGAVARLAFAHEGTAPGPQGPEELPAATAARGEDEVAFERERLRAGLVVTAVAYAGGAPVGAGSHQPVGPVSEVVGIGTLPAYRHRGIGAALTAYLTADALGRGARTVFLSAGDARIARVYERVGFRRIGTACVAEPAA